ncbi:MAG: amidohydrolase family protein [Acidobacteria bacterium]|nr:amidohydrolase family protein [Acidobacteriota bacterium]
MIKSIAISGLLVLCGAVQMASAQFYADMVLYNGQILTANSDDAAQFSIAQAVAIYDGKFRAVGSNDEVLKHSGPATQRIDLKGKTVLPGIIDTHRHVSPRDASSAAGRQDPTVHWTTKADGLAQLRTIALGKKPGEWIIPGTTGPEGLGDPPLLYQRKVLRQDIDPITPNNPVFIVWKATNRGILNTVALNMLLERYPDGLPGMDKDASGKFTGYMEGLAVYTFKEEFEYWAPFEVGAPVLKARLEQTAADGITTVSTWVNPYAISVYNLLDRKGELPVRIAYSHLGYKGVADPDPHVRRMGNLVGLGTDSLWMAAMAVMSVDGTVSEGRACLSKEYPREHRDFPAWLYQPWGPNGRCQLTDPMYSDREMILAANRYGIRIARTHVGGDRSTDEYLAVMGRRPSSLQVWLRDATPSITAGSFPMSRRGEQ